MSKRTEYKAIIVKRISHKYSYTKGHIILDSHKYIFQKWQGVTNIVQGLFVNKVVEKVQSVHSLRDMCGNLVSMPPSTSKERDVSKVKCIINVNPRKCACLPIWCVRERLKINLARMPAD